MRYLKDACLCIVISLIVFSISRALGSTFFENLIGSLLEVICGVFAINIASTALIAELINKVSEKTGYKFEKSKNTLIRELKIQAGLIFALVFLLVFYYTDYNKAVYWLVNYKSEILKVTETGLLSIFIYFIWLTLELGRALFAILEANYTIPPKKKED
ncbi:MAG TPA: hypothetical protein PLI68_09445 [Bacteroidia bacterium]|nr:hypothetical protein [Bacteroidia bacterium]